MKQRYATLLAYIGICLSCLFSTDLKAQVTFTTTPVTGVLVLPPDTNLVCPDMPMQLCFALHSPNPNSQITITGDNHLTFSTTSGASVMSPFTGQGTDNVSGCFSWTPTPADEGMKTLQIMSQEYDPATGITTPRIDLIKIFTAVTIHASPDDTVCHGESATVTVLSGGKNDYEWIESGGTFTSITTRFNQTTVVNPPATMTYIVTATDVYNGCKRKDNPSLNTNQDEVTIMVVDPKIDAGPDTIMCTHNTLQLNANLRNPQPGLTYAWEWRTINPAHIIFLDNPFTDKPLMRIPAGTLPADIPDFIDLILTVTPSYERCTRTDTLHVEILKSYYITTGDQPGDVTGLGYLGRQKGVSDTTICAGASVTLQGWRDDRMEYFWTPAAGVSTPLAFTPGTTTITPAATTTYVLTARKNGCTDSNKNVIIRVDPIPDVNIGPDRTICFGDTINFFAAITPDPSVYTDYKYQWKPGGSLSRADTILGYFTGYLTQELTFIVSTKAGCSDSDKAVYTVAPRQFLSVSADTAICPGDQARLHVTGDAELKSVLWSPAERLDDATSLDPVASPLYNTTYVVKGLDNNNCIDSEIVNVQVYPRPVIYLEDSAVIYPGQSYQMHPQGNCLYYSWFPATGLDLDNVAEPVATPLLNTNYIITARTEAGCSITDSIYVFVMPDSRIDMANAFSPDNGENGRFKVLHLGDASLKRFMIFNRWGEKLFETKDINEGWDGSFHGQPQSMGVYVYVVEAVTAKGKQVMKQGNVTLLR